MAPVAFVRAALFTFLMLVFAASGAAAHDFTVVAGIDAGTEVKLTNMRTGETYTAVTESGGGASFKGVPNGIYKLESSVSETSYVTVDDASSLFTLEKIAPGDPNRALQLIEEPNIRDSVQRALDRASTSADKEKALQEEARKVEEHLKRALAANERMPGLVNIEMIVDSLNLIQAMRTHYLALARAETPDRRQSGLQPWAWENPFPSYAGMFAGPERLELSQVGIGTVVSGGGERALLLSNDHVTGVSVGAQIGYRLDGFDWLDKARLVASYSYLNASGTDEAEVPVGTVDTAITYHRPAANNSTGLFLGGTGLSASQKVDIDAHRLTVGLTGHIPLSSDQRFFFVPFAGLKYERFKQSYEGTLQSLTFNDIRSTTSQEITQTLFGPSLGGYLFWVPYDSTRLTVGGKVDLFRSWDDLESRQHNICGACGPDEDDFEADVDDDDSYWTYRLNVQAGIEHELAHRLHIGFQLGARLLGDRAGVRNPENPSQPGPHLTTQSAANLYGYLGVRLRF